MSDPSPAGAPPPALAPPGERAGSAEPEAEVAEASRTGRRLLSIDGLRGVAIVLVVLGHGSFVLWPTATIDRIPALRGFFHGGAVEVFFVVGGFIVTRTLLRELDAGHLDAVRFYLRRLVRLGVQLVPLAAAVLAVHHFDATDTASDRGTWLSVANMLTHTLNIWSTAHPFEARPDLGHLWYLSVQQQVYLVLPLVLVLLAPYRKVLCWLLALTIVACTVWRFHVLAGGNWLEATTSTASRADGLLLGVLAAVTLPYWRGHVARAKAAATAAAVVLLVLLSVLPELPQFAFLRLWGIAFNIAAVVLVVALVVLDRPSVVSTALGFAPLAYLGRASLAIFVWHLPVFYLVARHTVGETWQERTAIAIGALAVITWASHRWVEEPVRLWLRTHLAAPSRRPVASPSAGQGDA